MYAIAVKKLDGGCGPREMPEKSVKKNTYNQIISEIVLHECDKPMELTSL